MSISLTQGFQALRPFFPIWKRAGINPAPRGNNENSKPGK